MATESLDSLEGRVAKLESKRKDAWDKAQVIVSAFVPVTLAILGIVVAQQGERTRSHIEKSRIDLTKEQNRTAQAHVDAQIQAAEVTAKVERAKLLHTYIDTLLTSDLTRQRLAMEGLLIGLDNDGRRLVDYREKSAASPQVAAAARERLEATPPTLPRLPPKGIAEQSVLAIFDDAVIVRVGWCVSNQSAELSAVVNGTALPVKVVEPNGQYHFRYRNHDYAITALVIGDSDVVLTVNPRA